MADEQFNTTNLSGLETFIHNFDTRGKSLAELRQALNNIIRQVTLYDQMLARQQLGPTAEGWIRTYRWNAEEKRKEVEKAIAQIENPRNIAQEIDVNNNLIEMNETLRKRLSDNLIESYQKSPKKKRLEQEKEFQKLDESDKKLRKDNKRLQNEILNEAINRSIEDLNARARHQIASKKTSAGFNIIERRNDLLTSTLALGRPDDSDDSDEEEGLVCRYTEAPNSMIACPKVFNSKANRLRHERKCHPNQIKYC